MSHIAGKVGAIYAQSGSATSITDGPIGTGDGTTTVFYLIKELVDCDATTDWSGTSLSTETTDKKEGTGALKDDVASPATGTEYETTYNPTGSWDLSDVQRISFWLKCDRASTAFTHARFYIYDTSGNGSYWDLTFSAATWTRFNLDLSSPDGNTGTAASLSAIDSIRWNFKAADTTAFYKLIDWVGYSPQGVDSVSIKVGGTTQDADTYTVTVWGKVTFNTAPSSGDITASYDYYDVSQVGGFFNWTIDKVADVLETTDFGDSGHRTYIAVLDGWSASAERHYITDERIDSWLGTKKIIKFFIDTSSSPKERYEGWAYVTGISVTTPVDALVNQSLSFQGTGRLWFENT